MKWPEIHHEEVAIKLWPDAGRQQRNVPLALSMWHRLSQQRAGSQEVGLFNMNSSIYLFIYLFNLLLVDLCMYLLISC
jgi:hypothetical protein